jgi:hypothetical protein
MMTGTELPKKCGRIEDFVPQVVLQTLLAHFSWQKMTPFSGKNAPIDGHFLLLL